MQRQVHVKADEWLYVGDDRAIDYDGARAAGLHALLFDPRSRHADLGRHAIRTLRMVAGTLDARRQ
jgi:FMN phosphatase YigB (HAD superfamily)